MQFVTFSTDFVVQNVAKRKQGTVLVQNVFPKNLMQFSRWRKSQVGTKKRQKTQNFPIFNSYGEHLPKENVSSYIVG